MSERVCVYTRLLNGASYIALLRFVLVQKLINGARYFGLYPIRDAYLHVAHGVASVYVGWDFFLRNIRSLSFMCCAIIVMFLLCCACCFTKEQSLMMNRLYHAANVMSSRIEDTTTEALSITHCSVAGTKKPGNPWG